MHLNGLQAIQDRILLDARENASQIEEQADRHVSEIEAAAEHDKERILFEARQRADVQAETMINRANSMAALENRKKLLQTRQNLIDQAIARAMELICRLPDEEKLSFYLKLIQRSQIKSGEVILAADDQHLAPLLLAGFNGKLSLAGEIGAFSSGLVLRSGLIEDNLTLELLIGNDRPEIVRLAAGILFDTSEG